MKTYFILFVILLFLYHSWGQPLEQDYTPIDVSQVTSSLQLQGLVFIGIQNATQQAIQDGSLPEGNYQVSQIISAAHKQDDYRFEVNITDGQGNTTHILFFITYDPSTGTTEVTSFEVLGNEGGESTTEFGEEVTEVMEVTEVTEFTEQLGEAEFGEVTKTEDGFIILDVSVVQNDTEIAGILSVGVQEVTKQAIANGSLYNSSYELAQVYSVQQNVSNPDEYRFYVGVRNSLLNTVIMKFGLIYDESSKTVEILSWGYANLALPYSGKGIIPEANGIPADYQEVNFNLSDTNSFAYQIGDAALQVAITTGYLEGTLPYNYFDVTNMRSVAEKFDGDKVYYRFDLDAADDYGDTARFIYVVSYDMTNSTTKLEEMKITDVVRAS